MSLLREYVGLPLLALLLVSIGCDSRHSTQPTKRYVQNITTWQFTLATDSLGDIRTVDGPINIALHEGMLYFHDPALSRLNALDIQTGKVKWGAKGNLDLPCEQLAYFSEHVLAVCQRGCILVFDSTLTAVDTIRTGPPYSMTIVDSLTNSELVAIGSYDEANDTGTGRTFYSQIVHLDSSLRSSSSVNSLGRTSHLDERSPAPFFKCMPENSERVFIKFRESRSRSILLPIKYG